MVLVHSAGAKSGYNSLCPTCYTDCGKRAITDNSGNFSIPNLSPDLRFDLLIVRKDYQATFVSKVDPATSLSPVKLPPRLSPSNPAQIARGIVRNAHGRPVKDVLVEQRGASFDMNNRLVTSFGGPGDWIDPIAVTDEKGEFEIAYKKPAKSVILQFSPRGMAPRLATIPTGAEPMPVTVTDGATVTGRLTVAGTPLPNAELVLSSKSRNLLFSLSDIRISANEKGEFTFTGVPPGRVWVLSVPMKSLASRNLAISPINLEPRDDGQTLDVGALTAKLALTISGRIRLPGNAPIPGGMHLNLSSETGDYQTIELPPDGAYEFKGLAPGVYSLNPAVKGFAASLDNPPEILIESNLVRDIPLVPKP